MKLFLQKKCKIFERWGLRPQSPVPPAAGGFAPEPPASGAGSFASRPPLASGGWGLRPQNPKTAPHCEFLATRLREFTKLPTGLSFFVVVASAVATMRHGRRPPRTTACAPPILVHSECFFGSSRNDKTTGNNGKRNNNFQTWFSFEVFSIVCKIAGHQLLYMNVTQ